jgi:hypothetical protein
MASFFSTERTSTPSSRCANGDGGTLTSILMNVAALGGRSSGLGAKSDSMASVRDVGASGAAS